MKNVSKLLFNGDINYIYDYDRKQHNQYYVPINKTALNAKTK